MLLFFFHAHCIVLSRNKTVSLHKTGVFAFIREEFENFWMHLNDFLYRFDLISFNFFFFYVLLSIFTFVTRGTIYSQQL